MVWDYFISHSTEDKLAIAEPLAKYLVAAQFKIWYDDFSLKLGDSLLASIDEGLAGSRFGIVILSEKFFAKRWPKSELAGLVATEGNRKRILPVWHNISAAAVAEHSPILADRKAIDSSRGLQAVSKAIVQASFPEREKNLPLQFHDESASELNEARGRFRALLEGGAQVADLRAFLSVNHDLLLKLGGYSSVLIPGFALSPSIFDFAILRPHGVTGPIDLELVTIGPLDRRDVDSTLRTITEQLGESSRSPEKPRNYGGGRLVGEFPNLDGLAKAIGQLAHSGNVHFKRSDWWVLKLLIISGRRESFIPNEQRAEMPTVPGLEIELASYDRLLDSERPGRSRSRL